jgi:hypothetical protein
MSCGSTSGRKFINRIDEIIVFHALGRNEIRSIVQLQLERVKRTAHGQGVELIVDPPLVEHFAAAGFQPELGARELRRRIGLIGLGTGGLLRRRASRLTLAQSPSVDARRLP